MKKIVALSLLAFETGLAWAGPVRTFPHAMDPRAHPDDARRLVKPPDSRTFDGRMQFMALRRMDAKTYKADLDRYVAQDRLGDIVWAHYGMLYNANVREQVEELKRRNLYLFDLWGFVPGSGPGEWSQFRRPDGVTEMFEEVLGERWLGMDNGEQDGRYVGGFSSQMVPYGGGRFHQYLNFQRHFERLDRLLGNKMATLVSLNYGHYFLREGCYTMIGAETAQALPNAQVYYSFIRGAGKQYGVPWFGNVSVFNRWGWKTYLQNAPVTSGRRTGSPVDGTSLALMKKLMYAQIFYNSVAVGFENEFYWRGRYTPDGKTALSPIGRIQRGAVDWCARNGTPGVMHVPVAVMVDFLSGWSFPRSLYSDRHHTVGVYKVWGTQPYDAGDYFTDVKKERESNRKKAQESIEETLKSAKLTDADKKSALAKIEELADRSEHESNIEALLKAKGFEKAIAVIGNSGINVVVRSEGLTSAQTLQIQDIVTAETNISLANIKIVPVK